MQAVNYVVNMTSVTISSYSTGLNTPANAIVYAINGKPSEFSPTSVMNLLVNNTRRLTQVFAAGSVPNADQQRLLTANTNIYIYKSSLIMNQVDIKRNIITDIQQETYFIEAIYLQQKYLHISNANIQLSGFIMHSFDPMSLRVENTYIDYHATMGGFVMRTSCNYPEAYVQGTVDFYNVTTEHPQERTATYREGVLMHAGAENLTVNYSKILFWGSLTEDKGQIEKQLTSN